MINPEKTFNELPLETATLVTEVVKHLIFDIKMSREDALQLIAWSIDRISAQRLIEAIFQEEPKTRVQ